MAEQNKNKNTAVIVVSIICGTIILVLLAVIAVLLVINANNAKMNERNTEMPVSNTVENEVAEEIKTENQESTDNTIVETGEAKESTLENPIAVGEWGISSKYNTDTKTNQEVKVKATKITRGEEAKNIAKEYLTSGKSIYQYEEPEAYQEWVVIDYDIDFGDTFQMGDLGTSPKVEAKITGLEGLAVRYNGISYITKVIQMGSSDFVKTKTASGKLLTQLPVGCTDYIIQFGIDSNTAISYVKGQ